MSNNSPSYYRARFAAFSDALTYENSLPDSREKQMRVSFLRNGFVPDSFLDSKQNKTTYVFGEIETNYEINDTIQNHIESNAKNYSNEPLTQVELQTLDTWFVVHTEKVCGVQKGGSGYSFPVKTIGTKKDIINAIDKTLNEKPTVIERSQNTSATPKLTLYKYKAKAIAIKLKMKVGLHGVHTLFGEIYPQFSDSPKKAIQHLLKIKKGVCTNVFYREDVGYIDLPFGENNKQNKGFGLIHIIEKHGEEIRQLGFNVSDFLTVCINQGNYKVSNLKNRIVLQSSMFRIVVEKYNEKAFVLSAFDLRKKALNGINGTIDGIDFTKHPLYVSTPQI